MLLKQSTVFTRAFYLGTAGLTPVVNISKAGAAFGVADGTVGEISAGWYKIAFTVDDTGTAGSLAWNITGAGVPTTLGQPIDQVNPAVNINGVVVT